MNDLRGVKLLKKIDSTFLISYQLPIDPQVRTGMDVYLFPSYSDFCLVWACTIIVHVHTTSLNSCIQQLFFFVQNIPPPCFILTSVSYNFWDLFLQWLSESWEEVWLIQISHLEMRISVLFSLFLFFTSWLVMGLCENHYLLPKPSLKRVERCTNLWV